MSVSTGTRPARNVETRAIEALLRADAQFIQSLKVFSGDSISEAGVAGAEINNTPKTATGNFLAREGDSMIGPLALGPPPDQTIDISATNTIDISNLGDNPQYSSNLQIEDIPTSTIIDIIEGAAFDGQILVLRTFAPSSPITISQATLTNGGNIQTADGNDLSMGDLQMTILIFDASLIVNANTGGTWRVLGTLGSGTGGVQDPIILNENNLGLIGVPGTVNIDFSIANFHRVIVGADVNINLINGPPSGKWEKIIVQFTQDSTGGRTVTFNDSFANGITPTVNGNANSITYIVFYSYNDGTNQIYIATPSVSDFASGVDDPNYIIATLSADQTSNIAVSNHVEFDTELQNNTLVVSGGAGQAQGIISGFLPGHIYECTAVVAFDATDAALDSLVRFFDLAAGQFIGLAGNALGVTNSQNRSTQATATAIFTPGAATDTLELRFTSLAGASPTVLSGAVAGDPVSYIKIVDITGFVGGGGTIVQFPSILIQDVNTITNPGATVNLDLSQNQSFVIEIDEDLEITFTNAPSGTDREEQFKLEIIQDAVGGHAVTYSQTINPVDPPVIDTSPNAREVLTGFARRDDIGTLLFNIYVVGS